MIGILISTFERYAKIAHFTKQEIKKQWVGYPPLFFSGLLEQGERYLSFKSDSRDWMGVTLEAVIEMRHRGLTHAYLILDDHPPVGPCHDRFLNEVLPALARKLEAVYIGLLGYGQHRNVNGIVLGQENGFLEQCSPSYLWKFSLHPGLWNLEALEMILKQRHAAYCKGERTAWNFERHEDSCEDDLLQAFSSRCFRVCGSAFLQEPTTMKHQIRQEALRRFLIDIILFVTKKTCGLDARKAVEKKLLWHFGHYLGPYPLFWSGLMQQGKAHHGFTQWLKAYGSKQLQEEYKNLTSPDAQLLQ